MILRPVLRERSLAPLAERLELVRAAADPQPPLTEARWTEILEGARAGELPYLLDVNAFTARVAVDLLRTRRPYVVDTGDDPWCLARNMGRGEIRAAGYFAAESLVLRFAAGVVCRSSTHSEMLRRRTSAPVLAVPDTVSDSIIDAPLAPADGLLLATFGSVPAVTGTDKAYGWEVIDVVARVPALRGLIIGAGEGIEQLRRRAARQGVVDRVDFRGWMAIDELSGRLSSAGAITSVQSNDRAGRVRTTGKLPIALGAGRPLLATRVGEAARTLPGRWLVEPGNTERIADDIASRIQAGVTTADEAGPTAKALAERFRRSTQAIRLRSFLADVDRSGSRTSS